MQFKGPLLTEKREAQRYSQRELAEGAGVKPSFITDLESGKVKRPNYPDWVKVARFLGEDPDLFFDDPAGSFAQETNGSAA